MALLETLRTSVSTRISRIVTPRPSTLGPRLGGGPVAEALDQPLVVVAGDERRDQRPRLLQRPEAMPVETPLLTRGVGSRLH